MLNKANRGLMAVVVVVVLMVCGLAWAGWSEPLPVLEVNTEFNDKLPFLSFDGLSLYFVRANTNSFYFARIYEAKREEAFGPFTSVNEISELNYSDGHVTGPWISPDNLRVYYNRTEPGSHWRLKFSERSSINDPWPTGNNVSELNVLGDLFDPALTVNELIIFFGVWSANQGDLYIGSRPNTSSPFSNIRKLTEINSSFHDGGPYISPDGLTLYFHSNRNGVSQLFKATRGSLMDPFGETQHLSVFDTPGGHSSWPALSSDGSALYFTRSFGSGGDIYVSYMADLAELEILGPNVVAENFQVQYKAIAHYDNNSTADVTASADWLVEPNDVASISTGLLTTEIIDLPEDVTISAEYTEDPNTVYAEKEVSILAICPSGSALEFDGQNDYVEIGDKSNLEGFSEVSIAAWIYWTGSGRDFIAGKEGVYKIDVSSGKIRFLTGNNWAGSILTSSQSINPNAWYHIVAAYNGFQKFVYINGQVDPSSVLTSGSLGTNVNLVTFGVEPSTVWHDWYKGKIDEVSIWNRALSAEEIWGLMHTRPDSEPNLVAYWGFDEGEGQEAADSSGNGNDGTLGSTGGVDNSDPCWVDSVPPVGICNLEGLVGRNISNVLDIKADILELLDIALGKEEALFDYMDDAFHNDQFDNLNKNDVVLAKQKLHSAIQQQEQAETAIGQSLEKLNDALDALDIDPTSWHQSEIEEEIIRADINADGVVDFRDFTILTEHWLESSGK